MLADPEVEQVGPSAGLDRDHLTCVYAGPLKSGGTGRLYLALVRLHAPATGYHATAAADTMRMEATSDLPADCSVTAESSVSVAGASDAVQCASPDTDRARVSLAVNSNAAAVTVIFDVAYGTRRHSQIDNYVATTAVSLAEQALTSLAG
jgi:hypothetical protein